MRTEWIAIGENKILKHDDKQKLISKILSEGDDVDGYEILKAPKPHLSMEI